MELSEVRSKLEIAEGELAETQVALFADFRTPHGALRVSVTDRLRRKSRKGRVWKSPAMLTALKKQSTEWFTVRLVSHHLRLLGVLAASSSGAHLVLVDYDDDKDD